MHSWMKQCAKTPTLLHGHLEFPCTDLLRTDKEALATVLCLAHLYGGQQGQWVVAVHVVEECSHLVSGVWCVRG
jgi:hypothetical protein